MKTAIPLLALLALALPLHAATHVVQQIGFTFDPEDITITQGDTVRWEWNSGIHTVTNGTGADDPDAGTLFDAPLDTDNQVFEYVFDTPGLVPYFCRPHELLGMVGTVTVEEDVTPVEGTPVATAPLRAYPNPFNPATSIAFSLPAAGHVAVHIHDAAGRLVRTLLDGTREAGPHTLVWDGRADDGRAVASGVYFARLIGPEVGDVAKLVLVQ